MAGDTRKQRVVLETSRHTISGEVVLPLEGLRTRLSDLLNAEGMSFVSIVDAEIVPLEGGETVEARLRRGRARARPDRLRVGLEARGALMADGDAIEGLERSRAKLQEYADSRGLVLTSESPWPGYVPAEQQTGPVRHAIWSLAGKFPGGAVGRLRHQAVFGIDDRHGRRKGQHTIMVARLPETVGYVPMLCVRPAELMSGLYYWGGDQRPRDTQRFESTELDRRYIVEIAKAQGQNWLWQLFSPALIDWIAHETPPDFGFKLETGVFTCECPQWRGQGRMDGEVDTEHLDLLVECSGKVASRIRDEVLEEIGTGSASSPDSAQAYVDWVSGPKHGKIIGAIMKLVGAAGIDDSVNEWGAARGLEAESPATFHSRNITLPLPGAATDVVDGHAPRHLPPRLDRLDHVLERRGHGAELRRGRRVSSPARSCRSPGSSRARPPSPGSARTSPPAALEDAKAGGLGISTAGEAAAVILEAKSEMPGHPRLRRRDRRPDPPRDEDLRRAGLSASAS